MKNLMKRHRERRQRMIAFFAQPDPTDLINTQPDIKEDVTHFKDKSATWETAAVEIETLEENSNAATKKAAMKAMAEGAARWGQRCLVRLRRLGLMNEAKLADHQPSDFLGMANAEAVDLAKAIYNMLKAHQSELAGQGITEAVLEDLEARIAAASGLETQPTAALRDLEAKRAALTAGDAELEGELEDIVSTLHAEFRYTKPDFDRELMTQYELGGNTGHRYTVLEGTARTSSGTPLSGYTVRRADDPLKKGLVDRTGHYSIKGMRGGEVVFELVNPEGVVRAERLLKLKMGTVVVWDWVV